MWYKEAHHGSKPFHDVRSACEWESPHAFLGRCKLHRALSRELAEQGEELRPAKDGQTRAVEDAAMMCITTRVDEYRIPLSMLHIAEASMRKEVAPIASPL